MLLREERNKPDFLKNILRQSKVNNRNEKTKINQINQLSKCQTN